MSNKFETNADGNYYFFPSLRSPDTAVPGNKKRQKVETLTNATVQIKNSVIGYITGTNSNYTIHHVSANKRLITLYKGYQTLSGTFNGHKVINMTKQ